MFVRTFLLHLVVCSSRLVGREISRHCIWQYSDNCGTRSLHIRLQTVRSDFPFVASRANALFISISTYLIVAAFFGGLTYVAYLSFVPQPKKTRKSAVSAPVGPVTATAAGGYQEEWIPDHHLKKTKRSKKNGFASSADELSGVESSVEKRKSKK